MAPKGNRTQTVSSSETWVEQGTGALINETEFTDAQISAAMWSQQPEVASMIRWQQATVRRQGGLFERDRYANPRTIYEEFKMAHQAVNNDDVVSGVMESTEALAFQAMSLNCEDEDEEDLWNQAAEDIDLDARLREMWREMFTVSQFYAATWYTRKTIKVGGKTKAGVKRKKSFENVLLPSGITLLDPLKVIPVGNFMWNQEQLVYVANRTEAQSFYNVLAGSNTTDLIVTQLIQGEYVPDTQARVALSLETDVPLDYLFFLNPDNVWRHTATRPQYQRFADVRLKSVFEMLDLKTQLHEMDRAHLIGGTNFIVLVKKGSDTLPAKPAEISALAQSVQQASRVPLIVGDHRLSVEIVTPDNNYTLDPTKYDAIDDRIRARLYQTFTLNDGDIESVGRVVAAGMESRRHMLRRAIERNIFKPTVARNDQLTDVPKMSFHPNRISLNFDRAMATFMQDLRDRGDVSRESSLHEVGLDQAQEAILRQREKERYDDIFTPTIVPFSSPQGAAPGGTNPASQKTAGRTGGGNRNGGGSNVDSKTSNKRPTRPRKGDSG